ncbi:26S proteasome subunit P45 [Pisolithus croceorrhizus]|nr:26S proteasome subunit P45 [Pisolithus croceorrhizus]
MEVIGMEIQKEEPTFESVVTEKAALYKELQEEDLYTKYKKLERHLELLDIQESYIKDEQANLKRELIRAQEEVKRIKSVPLVIGQFLEAIDQQTGIVGSTTGSNYVVRILSTLDRELIQSIAMLGKEETPDVTYSDVGGMDSQKQEIREAKIGIDPPRGVLLYGPTRPSAHHTTASFIRVVGSEFVQKYLGEGPRMVRDVFRLALQRILLELLNQMDGFDQTSNVKVIMATNRADTLDPALLRPGRLDRKIEFPLPSRREKRLIFQTCYDFIVSRPDRLSSAEIAAIVQAAGLQAVRKNRYVILPVDFEEAWKVSSNGQACRRHSRVL